MSEVTGLSSWSTKAVFVIEKERRGTNSAPYGKPAQFNTGDAQSFKKAIDMTDDELEAIASRGQAL